jgi:hypothetical protein
MRDVMEVKKAPKLPPKGRKMKAKELTKELAIGVITICLFKKEPITVDIIKQVRPLLAETYTKKYSVIPTYLSVGRKQDGLGLYRAGAGKPFPPSFENASLAAQKLLEVCGGDQEQAADLAMFSDWEALLESIDTLPSHEECCRLANQKEEPCDE